MFVDLILYVFHCNIQHKQTHIYGPAINSNEPAINKATLVIYESNQLYFVALGVVDVYKQRELKYCISILLFTMYWVWFNVFAFERRRQYIKHFIIYIRLLLYSILTLAKI